MRYMSPDEAAQEILGWSGAHRGQKLLRLILSKERQEKREIAVRGPGAGKGTRYRLTESMLRLHFPELFATQIDAIAVELSRKIDQLRSTIGATVDERIAPQIQTMRAEHRQLSSEVARLAENTAECFSRIERRLAKNECELQKKVLKSPHP